MPLINLQKRYFPTFWLAVKMVGCISVLWYFDARTRIHESSLFWLLAVICVSIYALYILQRFYSLVLMKEHLQAFSVSIQPIAYSILVDHQIIQPEQWEDCKKRIAEDKRKYSALRDGLSFTVLNQDLIFWNDDRKFSSRALLLENLFEEADEQLAAERVNRDNPDAIAYPPKFYMRFRDDGILLFITKPVFVRDGIQAQPEAISLALIPQSVFRLYLGPPGRERPFDEDIAQADKDLKAAGWTTTVDGYVERDGKLQHKYFVVYHQQV